MQTKKEQGMERNNNNNKNNFKISCSSGFKIN